MTPLEPDYCSSPGEFLEDLLLDLNMTQAELASRTGLTAKTINALIKAKASVTPETALKLEVATGTKASLWISLEQEYQKWKAFDEKGNDPAVRKKAAEFVRGFPYKDLVHQGYCQDTDKALYRQQSLLKFFGVYDEESYHQTYDCFAGAARVGHSKTWNNKAFAAWYRMGELKAQNAGVATFDKNLLKQSIPKLRSFCNQSPGGVWKQIQEILLHAGVIAVVVPEMTDCHVYGLSRFVPKMKRAIVQLSLRNKNGGTFWFNLFHELAHLLNDSKKTLYLNLGDDESGTSELASIDPTEQKANAFSRNVLIPKDHWDAFTASSPLNKSSILSFAQKEGILPEIVLGFLQFDKRVVYSAYSDLKQPFTYSDFSQ